MNIKELLNSEKFQIHRRIGELKRQLDDMDYKTDKYIDGEIAEEEYAEITAQRKVYRAEINELEEELHSLDL